MVARATLHCGWELQKGVYFCFINGWEHFVYERASCDATSSLKELYFAQRHLFSYVYLLAF
jgi:hypothetical protein